MAKRARLRNKMLLHSADVCVFVRCFVEVILLSSNGVAYAPPNYNWPIIPGHQGLEIIHNVTSSISDRDLHVYNTMWYPNLDCPCTWLDGSYNSWMDVSIPSGEITSDFALTVFYLPSAVTHDQTLLHFKTDDSVIQTADGYTEILAYSSGTSVIVIFYCNQDECQKLSVPKPTTNMWTPVIINQDEEKSRPDVTINEVRVSGQTLDQSYTLALPGTVRIGGSFLNTIPSMSGCFTCFLVFGSMYQSTNLTKAAPECLSSTWPISLTFESGSTCVDDTGYFVLVQKNVVPQVTPTSQAIERSKVTCASTCINTVTCQTFAFSKSAGSCKLYAGDYSGNLGPEPETNYYLTRRGYFCTWLFSVTSI